VSNASARVGWAEGQEQLGVICTKVVAKGKGEDESTERGSVHDEK